MSADPRDREAEVLPLRPAHTFAWTDYGNAERLVAAHGRDLRHVPGLGWLAWDGRRFERSEDGEPMRRAKLGARALYRAAGDCDDDEKRKEMVKWARQSEAAPRLSAAVALAATEREVLARVADLDADPWALNVANGTVDLRTGKLREHRRSDLLTKLAPIAFDPAARCPLWEGFLQTAFDGNNDLVAFFRRAVGYSLTSLIREHVLFICHGGGSNGKDTALGAIGGLLGEYAHVTPSSTLLEQRHEGVPNDLARLRGARFVTASETGSGRRLNEERIKEVTGGGVISARYMRAEWFEFRPQFKLWLCTNHLPRIHGTDHGIWRRVRLIPFRVTIPDEQQDEELPAKLAGELPGILNWAIAGCLDWQQQGLAAPEVVSDATADYRSKQDAMGRFLAECCEEAEGYAEETGALWRAWCRWADDNREEAGTSTSFGLALSERHFEGDKASNRRIRRGLRLRTQWRPQ